MSKYDLTSPLGFTYAYFELLPQFKTQDQAFEYLKNQVTSITGIILFDSYDSFRDTLYSS